MADLTQSWNQLLGPSGKSMDGPEEASEAQRLKNLKGVCLVCGEENTDPAHLCPRRLGPYAGRPEDRVECGCDEADCVIPLCRAHHSGYDGGEGSDLKVNLLSKILRPVYLREQYRDLRQRIILSGPETYEGLLVVTRVDIHPELKHAYGHMCHFGFGFAGLRRLLLEGSRFFREDESLRPTLAELRALQRAGRL